MENLALVVYNPTAATNNPNSPLLPPPDHSMAMVVYEHRSEEASNSTPGTERKRKERVKALLKKCVPFSPEELPAGLNPGSVYYKGTCIGLPKGWVIELRPRSVRMSDLFFYAARTGKQFRSLIEVRNFLRNQTPSEEPETEEYPFPEIIRRNKRGKGTKLPQQPQPLQQLQPEPHVQSTLQETGANTESFGQLIVENATHGHTSLVGSSSLPKKVENGTEASASNMNELTVNMKEEIEEMVKQQVQESITVFVKRLLQENPGISINIPSFGLPSDGTSGSTKQ